MTVFSVQQSLPGQNDLVAGVIRTDSTTFKTIVVDVTTSQVYVNQYTLPSVYGTPVVITNWDVTAVGTAAYFQASCYEEHFDPVLQKCRDFYSVTFAYYAYKVWIGY